MIDSVCDFKLGDTISGTNDDGQLINIALEGREYTFPVSEDVATAMNMSKRTVGTRITARIVRNTSGAAILPGELVLMDIATDGVEGLGHAGAKSTAGDRFVYPVDSLIPAAGCANNDLCFVIVGGVAKIKQPAVAETLAIGDYIKAGNSGRLAEEGTIATGGHLIVASALEANSTNNALVLCWVHPSWE